MHKNIIYVSFAVSIFVFTPSIAEPVCSENKTSESNYLTHHIQNQIASTLLKRGLEEGSAHKLASDLLLSNEKNLERMVGNIVHNCSSVTHQDVVEYLSSAALHRKSVALESYDQLIHMVTTVSKKSLNKEQSKELESISKMNKLLA